MVKFGYYLPKNGESVDNITFVNIRHHPSWYNLPDDADELAQEAAEHYHNSRDGWEDNWPIDFVITDEAGNELGKFEIDRETVPNFVVSLKE